MGQQLWVPLKKFENISLFNPQRCWASTHLTDRGYPLNRGLSCYNMESPSLNHNGWYVWRLEWHTPCTVKIFSVDFAKRVGACIVPIMVQTRAFHIIAWQPPIERISSICQMSTGSASLWVRLWEHTQPFETVLLLNVIVIVCYSLYFVFSYWSPGMRM
jgi:hypothetical protein